MVTTVAAANEGVQAAVTRQVNGLEGALGDLRYRLDRVAEDLLAGRQGMSGQISVLAAQIRSSLQALVSDVQGMRTQLDSAATESQRHDDLIVGAIDQLAAFKSQLGSFEYLVGESQRQESLIGAAADELAGVQGEADLARIVGGRVATPRDHDRCGH